MAAPLQAVVRELAQGVADLLNLQTFSQPFEATRAWRAVDEIEATEQPLVTVVPDLRQIARASRGKDQHDCLINVVVQRQHGDSNPSQIAPIERCDELADLAQEIEDFLMDCGTSVIATTNLRAEPMGGDVTIDEERLVADGIFAVNIAMLYRLWR